jgi:hypothetical protein
MYDFIIKSEMCKWFISNSEGQIIKIWMTFCPCIGNHFIFKGDNNFFSGQINQVFKEGRNF